MSNPNIMTIHEVCRYLNLSIQTVRRRIKERREGIGSFPLSITGSTRKGLWRRSDIESWNESEPGGQSPKSTEAVSRDSKCEGTPSL